MPRFVYKAKDGPVKTVEGELLAESETAALAKIEGMGYCPVWVREKDFEEDAGIGGSGLRRIRQSDVNIFTRQLACLIKSGVPILRALRTVREQSSNRRFRRVVRDIEDTVRDGGMLSDALSKHPAVFPELYVNMVRAGETGGILDAVLHRLAEMREKEEDVRKKVQSGLAYPVLVLIVGLVTVIVMVTFFLPRIAGLFSGFTELPLPTRILIRTSEFCSRYWKAAIVPVVLVVAILKRLTSGGKGRALVDLFKLRLPLAGTIIMEADIARFARTLSLLVQAGIPVESGLRSSANTLSNSILKAEIESIRKKTVDQGASIADGLKGTRYFPVFARNMIAVGEESGRIDELLADVASFYEKEVERRVVTAATLIEPVLILVVGAIVGFIVFAMLLPIFAITRTIA